MFIITVKDIVIMAWVAIMVIWIVIRNINK